MAGANAFTTVWKILSAQLAVSLLAAIVFLCLSGGWAAWSALLGGGAALGPNLYFAYKMYLARQGEAQAVINAFYAGEAVKFVLTAAIFALLTQVKGLDFLALLAGFAAALSVFWFALILWRD